jgi:hypothetical protein
MAGGLIAQKPLTIYSLPGKPEEAAKLQAGGAVLFDVGESSMLAAGAVPDGGAPVYSGLLDELRWVTVRRGGRAELVSGKALYSGAGRYLLRAADIPMEVFERPEDYWVKPVREVTLLASDSLIINPNLAYNPTIAEMADLVDSAKLRSWVTAMQNFGTRHVSAGNHASVTAWVKAKFDSFGIADVRLDTCYNTVGHNVIATIPGLYDTVTIYLAGGHYDSYATSNAPGADDNASGAAAALEYARILSLPGNRPNSTVKLVCFDAEEIGLYGSEYLASRMKSQGAQIGCMLNFDMIGAENNDSVFYSQRYTGCTAQAQLLIRMGRLYGRHADTNAVGQYSTQYLQQSDSYPFYQEGYPVAWVLERTFSTVYHTANDNISHMNMRYMTGNVKAGFGFFATLAFHPAAVQGVQIQEHGIGTQLSLTWRRATAANITGYRVYWGRASENYTGQMDVADTVAVIQGLMPDSLYYVAVAAVNTQNQESVFLREYQARPFAGTAVTAFFDDFESGLSQWTRGHSGGTVDWDTTSAQYHSPSHSVTDSRAGNYGNNVNSWLQVVNGINLTGYSRASLSWWERYSTESGWDWCYPEYSLNGGAWTSLVARYSGTQTTWTQRSVDLTSFCPTATNFKFRFQFTTDGNTVDDGWYVDDVLLTGFIPTGVSQGDLPASAPGAILVRAYPNPVGRRVVFQVDGLGDNGRLDIYDVAGRHIVRLNVEKASGQAEWYLSDRTGREVANGVYFYRAAGGTAAVTGRIQVIR